MIYSCCLCTVRILPEGPTVHGVTLLGNKVFLLRRKVQDEFEVYDIITYRLQQCLTVTNLRGLINMTSCEFYMCIRIYC